MTEFERKKSILDSYMGENGFDGILYSMKDNEAWITCGGSCWVGKDSQGGSIDLLYMDGKLNLLSTNIEALRVRDEELCRFSDYGVVCYPWYADHEAAIRACFDNKRIASDNGYPGTENRGRELARLRFSLMPEEIERARNLGRDCAKAMLDTCMTIRRGDTEHDVAAMITEKLMHMGIEVPCCLVAADERIKLYRHPIPTFKKIDKRCMVVICGVREGLTVAMTRLISFGAIDEELEKRHMACAKIDTRFMESTRIGRMACDVFKDGIAAYAEFGYPDEWKCHHQGGAIGYDCRDYHCDLNTAEKIVNNQMFAWNPSISGTKMEDTFLLTENGAEVLTEIPGWPTIEIETANGTVKRPAILIRE